MGGGGDAASGVPGNVAGGCVDLACVGVVTSSSGAGGFAGFVATWGAGTSAPLGAGRV